MQLTENEVDCWRLDQDELKQMEEEELYPPRFVVKVNGHQATNQATALVNIKFITAFIINFVYSTSLTIIVLHAAAHYNGYVLHWLLYSLFLDDIITVPITVPLVYRVNKRNLVRVST